MPEQNPHPMNTAAADHDLNARFAAAGQREKLERYLAGLKAELPLPGSGVRSSEDIAAISAEISATEAAIAALDGA